MHRTTIELDDKLLRSLKEICAREKKTFKQLVLDLIRAGWTARYRAKKEVRVGLARWITSKNPLPRGIDPADRSTYWPFIQRPLA